MKNEKKFAKILIGVYIYRLYYKIGDKAAKLKLILSFLLPFVDFRIWIYVNVNY